MYTFFIKLFNVYYIHAHVQIYIYLVLHYPLNIMFDEPGSHNTCTFEPSVHPRGSEKTSHRSATTPQERQQLYNQTVEALQCALDHLNITLENMCDHTNKQRGETIRHELVHLIDLVDNYNPYDEVNIEEFY